MVNDRKQEKECPMCGHTMIDIQACHDLVPNCGAHLDCSERLVEDPSVCAGTVKNKRSRTLDSDFGTFR